MVLDSIVFFCRVWVYKIQRVGLGFRFSGFRVFGLRVSFEGDAFSRVLCETAAVTRGILFAEQQACTKNTKEPGTAPLLAIENEKIRQVAVQGSGVRT